MENFCGTFESIVKNVEKVIIGKRETIELLLIAFFCDGHVIIEDIPGVGKTSLASAVSRSVQCSFRRIQFTPDVLPSDITGFYIYNPKSGEFEFRKGLVMSNIILADEINRTPPRTQASLLEVMEERQVTVEGNTFKLPSPFMVIATQNPAEYLGTYPLPEAQIDRFFLKLSMGYPQIEEEIQMLARFKETSPLFELEPVVEKEEIIKMQAQVRQVYVDNSISRYIIEIINKTRNHNDIILGASPRASLCLYRGAQGWALRQGRNYVLPDDVKKLVIPVLSHRLMLKQEAKIKRISTEEILCDILHSVKIPSVNINILDRRHAL